MLNKHNISEPALHINEINVNNKYKFIRKIGKGSYGEVWLVSPNKPVTHKPIPVKQYVLKRLNLQQSLNAPSQNDIESAEQEAKLLSTLKHPNIVAYTESFRSNDGFLNIVMAYCEGGDLYTKLKEKKTKKELLVEDQIIEWFIQICMALQYIHEKNILHRDLKTQNIFLTKNEIVKVGDLGIARVLESGTDFATTIVGTPYYMSPEIFSQKPYGQKSDIWSLGCCVYEMITFEHAFNAKDMNSLVVKIIREQTPQLSKVYSKQLRDITTSMLKKNPEDRPTAKSILQDDYIKRHIMRLLEKAQTKCQSQFPPKSQSANTVSPVSSPSRRTRASDSSLTRPTSATNPSISRPTSAMNSPPSRPTSATNPSLSRPTSAANSPPSRPISASNNSPSKHRLLQHNHTPILPSHSRPPPSYNTNRSTPSVEPIQSNEPKVSDSRIRRRHIQACRSNPLPLNNDEKDLEFLSNLRQNDTLQRFRRNQQISNHLKQQQQQQQPSSSDEQDSSPVRRSDENASQPVIKEKQTRASSIETNINLPTPPIQITGSYDSHQGPKSIARQRRRQNKLHSSSPEYSTPNESPSQTTVITNESPQLTSQDNLLAEIEKKKEGEKDMNDFVMMLTATLRLANPNELTDSNKTLIDDENEDSQNRIWSIGERTMAGPLHETNRLHQRCQSIRANCLREISPDRLRRVLQILENVSESQVTQEMINELGEDLFNRYSAQIFSLKFYEDTLFTHS